MRAWRHIYKSGLAGRCWHGRAAAPRRYADERILSFDETVTVNADGSLYVRELIRVRAEGSKIRRGIYRDFPTIYQRQRWPADRGGFAFESATRDGQPNTGARKIAATACASTWAARP